MFHKLNLNKHKSHLVISGINQGISHVDYCTKIKVASTHQSFVTELSFLIIPNITGNIPQKSFDKNTLSIPSNIHLADSRFNISQQIDILLGSDIFWQLLKSDTVTLHESGLILRDTHIGWILSGQIHQHQHTKYQSLACTSQTLDSQLENFWKVDDFQSPQSTLTNEESLVEKCFINTTTRDKNGRFVVKIPLKENFTSLGNSRELATRRFYSLERRLERHPNIKAQYIEFINEYKSLGHMSQCTSDFSQLKYFLPHHHVIREASTTTKLRVVFDGSLKTSSGISLNDVQFTGPSIQSDLFSILVKFRKHTFVAMADIEKMYRQIQVHPSQQNLQKIVWRVHPHSKLEHYQLNTVTYGTASAPYLAVRCLHELANVNKKAYPTESHIIINDMYVDDLLTGANNIDTLKQYCTNISTILGSAGFNLRKWMSNTTLLETPKIKLSHNFLNLSKYETKTLGINYIPSTDAFVYSFKTVLPLTKITKRNILSKTAQIFDPLGLLTPITVIPKLLIQTLWKLKLDWDQPIPADIEARWLKFETNLEAIEKIQIPRHVCSPVAHKLHLHGFADASEKAYGACIYIKSFLDNGSVQVHLVTAKSRVAPVSQISLPRLELCATVI